MGKLSDSIPWATIMMAVLVGVAAIAGGVVAIVNPGTLSFQDYLDQLKTFAIAVGVLGVGRGIVSHGKSAASAGAAAPQANEAELYGTLAGDVLPESALSSNGAIEGDLTLAVE